jgi:RluA family pseudouridine synthase
VPDITVHPDDAGQRLDRFVRRMLPALPLSGLYRLLRTGAIALDGRRAPPGQRLAAGQVVRLPDRPAERPRAVAQRLSTELAIVARDDDLLVVDKPAGMAVHAGTRQRTDLATAVKAMLSPSTAALFVPAPAHRLDAATSGLVVFGVSGAGLRGATALFREGRVEKTYLAVVARPPAGDGGCIDLPLGVRDAGPRAAKAVPAVGGRFARTRWRVLRRRAGLALLQLELDGGRTHQARAHLAAAGMPILGDRRYGGAPAPRLMLHASRLRFAHPTTGTALDLSAPPPADFALAP